MYRDFGKTLKENVNIPVILAGRMENPQIAIEALGKCCDIVSYGRQLLTDPQYPEKVRTNRLDEIRPCLGCHEGCLGHISNGPVCCAVNPSCGREEIYGLTPSYKSRYVLVIGGGLAGMETARVCAERGHNVTLCEKSSQLGGHLVSGSVPDFKRYDRTLIKWYVRQLELLKVTIKTGCEVSIETVKQLNPEVIVTATGSIPVTLKIDGVKEIFNASDVLLGKAETGANIVMVGGGLVGCETALWLAMQGKNVTVIEKLPYILGGPNGLPHMNHYMLDDLLEHNGVKIMTLSTVLKSDESGVTIQNVNEITHVDANTIVGAVGYQSDDALYNSMKDLDIRVLNVSDSRRVRNIMYTIWDAYEVARNI